MTPTTTPCSIHHSILLHLLYFHSQCLNIFLPLTQFTLQCLILCPQSYVLIFHYIILNLQTSLFMLKLFSFFLMNSHLIGLPTFANERLRNIEKFFDLFSLIDCIVESSYWLNVVLLENLIGLLEELSIGLLLLGRGLRVLEVYHLGNELTSTTIFVMGVENGIFLVGSCCLV